MDWMAECKRWHDDAVRDLKSEGHTPFMLRIYPLATDDCVVWLEPDGLSDKARKKVRRLSESLPESNPSAVLICSDAWLATDAFWDRYGLQSLDLDKKTKRYTEILNRDYGGTLANVPDYLKSEAVCCNIKGPRLMPFSAITFYHRDSNGIVIDKSIEKNDAIWGLIADWWKQAIQ